MTTRTTMLIPVTVMTTERQPASRRRRALVWPLLGITLVLGALAASSFLPTPGPRPSMADSLIIDLEAVDDRANLWSAVSIDSDGFREVTFEHLNDFRYQPPGGSRIDYSTPALPPELGRPFEERVPERVRELDGQKVAILGFVMPLDGTLHAMTEFALVRNMMICCYGVVPQLTEWILVEAKPEQKIRYHMNIPVLLRGVLEIEEVVEQGFVVSLLEMEAHDLKVLDYREFDAYYQRTGVR